MIILKHYSRRMDTKSPRREIQLSRKKEIYHVLACFINNTDIMKYIYKVVIDTEMTEESLFRQNMSMFYLLGGKYWPSYVTNKPVFRTLISCNIFKEKLPLNRNMEWIIKNRDIIVNDYEARDKMLSQIVMIGTPGLFIEYPAPVGPELLGIWGPTAPTPNRNPPIQTKVMFINHVNDGPNINGYGLEELKEDYDMFIDMGVPITLDFL